MKILLSLVFITVSLLYSVSSQAAGWVNLGADDIYQYAFNEDSIVREGKAKVKVLMRYESKDEATRQRILAQRETKKDLYKDYQGSKQLMEIDCSKWTLDVLSSEDYKNNGETIWSMTFSIRDPDPITEGSRMDSLAQTLCKKK